MEKKIIEKFGKKYYLLGRRKEDNEKVWLEQGKFDCEWYWGIGYVEIFNKRYTNINEHTHFDSLFLKGNKCCYDLFKEYFSELTINDTELWKLLEDMSTIYNLRNYSDMIYRGGSHITTNTFKDEIKNEEEYKRINTLLIPKILDEVYKILGEE